MAAFFLGARFQNTTTTVIHIDSSVQTYGNKPELDGNPIVTPTKNTGVIDTDVGKELQELPGSGVLAGLRRNQSLVAQNQGVSLRHGSMTQTMPSNGESGARRQVFTGFEDSLLTLNPWNHDEPELDVD